MTDVMVVITYPSILMNPMTQTVSYAVMERGSRFTHPFSATLPRSIPAANYTVQFSSIHFLGSIPHEYGANLNFNYQNEELDIKPYSYGGLPQYIGAEILNDEPMPEQTLIPLDSPPYPSIDDPFPAPPGLGNE